MLRIDNNLLQEVGLDSLPDSEKNSLLKHIYETLEMRVGVRLADQMSNEQLDEFERYFEAKDDAGAFKWLETNFPNYKDIVQEEFDKLKSEVAKSAPQILSSSQAQTVQAPVSQPANPASPAFQPLDNPVPTPMASPSLSPATPPQSTTMPQEPAYAPYNPPQQPVNPMPNSPAQTFSAPPAQPGAPMDSQPTGSNFSQYQAPVAPPPPINEPPQLDNNYNSQPQPPYPDEQPPAGQPLI